MSEIASAFVSLTPDVAGFGSRLSYGLTSEVDSAGKRLGSGFGKVFGLAAGALAAAGIGNFLKGSIEEAREAQKVGAQTEAVIKSTGAAAGITAEQIGGMAGRLSALTGIDDEAIQAGENLLLTFTNIRNEVGGKFTGTFDSATQVMVDMSAALGQDLKSSAVQVGKALNDPIKGITALSRVGVSFTDQQKKQIATMVEAGNVTGAQALILGELNKEFGGSAEATATFGDKAAVAFGNIKEQIGTALLPALDAVFKLFLAAVPTITRLIDGIGPAIGRVQTFLAPVVAQIAAAFGGEGASSVVGAFKSAAAAVQTNLLPVLQTAANTFQTVILPAALRVGEYLRGQLAPVLAQVGGVIRDQVLPIASSLAQFFYGRLYPALVQTFAAVATKLRPAFEALVQHFQTSVVPNVQKLLTKFEEYRPTIEKVVLAVVKITGKVVEFAAQVISFVLPKVLKLQGFLAGALVSAISGVIDGVAKAIGWLGDFGGAFIDGVERVARFQRAVVEKVGQVISVVRDLPGKVLSAVGDLGDLLVNAGRDIIQGLIDGIGDMVGKLTSKLGEITDLIPLKKGPPEKDRKLLNPAGRLIMQGLIDGLVGALPRLESTLTAVSAKFPESLARVRTIMETERDRIAGVVDSLRSAFESLADSVSQNFTTDLFSVSNVADFTSGAWSQIGNLQQLKAAFRQLVRWNVDPGFISALFTQGGPELVMAFADGTKSGAMSASTLFNTANSLTNQIGRQVAMNDDAYAELTKQTRQLGKIEKHLAGLPKSIGDMLNGAAGAGQRKRARG